MIQRSAYMYRFRDDAIVFERPGEVSVETLLAFIERGRARKAELEPGGYTAFCGPDEVLAPSEDSPRV